MDNLEAAVSVAELNTEEMRRSEEITDEADIETRHRSEHGRSLSSSCRRECIICQVEAQLRTPLTKWKLLASAMALQWRIRAWRNWRID